MVQDQLVEYVSSQMKLGVARATIKSALIGAGWQETDVEDTLKKAEGSARPVASSPAASPAAFSAPRTSSPAFVSQAQLGKTGEPQAIRVSDLVSASGSATAVSMKMGDKTNSFIKASAGPKKGGSLMKIVGIAVIVLLAGLAGFLYWQNTGLSSKEASLASASAAVATNITSLNNEVAQFDASNTALTAEVASLTAENADLKANLSFAAVPPLASGAPATETVSLTGKLTAGRSSYALTTSYGVVAYVGNAKDAKVIAALAPLLTSTSSVTLTGTHVPGSQYFTITAVNGTSVQ